MAEVVQEIIGLHGGVSQQNETLRLRNQVESSINCYHTIESGVRRRNPTVLIKENTGISNDNWTYSYDRGLSGVDTEKYSVIIDSSGLRVLNLVSGEFMTVANTSGTYLEPFSNTGYSGVTVKDTTFITNRNKIVTTTATVSPTVTSDAFIWVKLSDPIDGYIYTVTIDGNTFTSTSKLSTTAVATDFKNQINAHASYSATSSGNIVRVTGSITNFTTSDNYGDAAIGFMYKHVPTEDDLPASMPYEMTIELTGQNNSDVSYWLKSVNGRWEETTGSNVKTEFNDSTMPHQLQRLTDGTFTFGPVDWTDRVIGDDDNAKIPSFVNANITDLFFFKNRLGMLAPNSIIFSEVGEYYNFWKTSQVAVLDSDRIDIDIDAKKAIKLHYVEFLQNDIIIFGDRSQFKLEHSGPLTPTTLSATLISEYDVNVNVRPLSIDNKIFFLALNGEYNTVFTYTREELTNINKASSISMHIPEYLDKDISQIVGSSVNGVLLFRSNVSKDTVYVYKYLEDSGKLIQSSWFLWKFTADIHSIFTTESKLHLLLTRTGLKSDIEWTEFNAIWHDEFNWLDTQSWLDEEGDGITALEEMELYPKPISNSFIDRGDITYTSIITLSEYLAISGDNTLVSNKLNLKTIFVKGDTDSKFRLSIENKNRGTSRIIDETYVIGRKPYIMGRSKDTRISILSSLDGGFEINGVAYETRLNNRSRII